MRGYVYDQAWEQERERLAGIEADWDPGTIRHLEGVGVAEGWWCLEIGAGAGSIARWLAERVGPDGRVVATDLDTRFVDALDLPNLEALRHDIVADDPPAGPFDLVHARMVLEHLPDRAEALRRAVSTLAPGGRLIVEDLDWSSTGPVVPSEAFSRAVAAVLGLMEKAGYDPFYGRRLLGELESAGLVEVEGEGRSRILDANSPGVSFYRLSLEAVREPLVSSGALAESDVEAALALFGVPGFRVMTPTLVAAWGRRPES